MGKVVKLKEKDLISMVTKSLKNKDEVSELDTKGFDVIDDDLIRKLVADMSKYKDDIVAKGTNKVQFKNSVISAFDDSVIIKNLSNHKLEEFNPSETTMNKIKELVDGVLGETEKEPEEIMSEPESVEEPEPLVSSQLVDIKLTKEGAQLLHDLLTHDEIEFDDEAEEALANHLIVDLKAVLGQE